MNLFGVRHRIHLLSIYLSVFYVRMSVTLTTIRALIKCAIATATLPTRRRIQKQGRNEFHKENEGAQGELIHLRVQISGVEDDDFYFCAKSLSSLLINSLRC